MIVNAPLIGGMLGALGHTSELVRLSAMHVKSACKVAYTFGCVAG